MSQVKMVRISDEEAKMGKYQYISHGSEEIEKGKAITRGYHEAKVFYNNDGSINEESTYSDSWKRQNKLGKYKESQPKEEPKKDDSKEKSEKKSSKSISLKWDWDGSCAKFIFTIIPVLPIWWVIKLFIKAGASVFYLIEWLFIAIFYIISYPIRLLLSCCLDEDERRFLPKWERDILPAYSFVEF